VRAPTCTNIIGLQQGVIAGTKKGLFGQTNNNIGGDIYVVEIFICGVGVGISIIMCDHQCAVIIIFSASYLIISHYYYEIFRK
jgi:hypothetical protein